MTEIYHHEQQTKFLTSSPLITQANMPSFHPSTRHRPLVTRQLSNTDNDDPDPIYKDALIIEIFQHWKAKALEHQNSINNAENIAKSNHFTQALKRETSSTQIQNTEKTVQENTTNNTISESLTITESQKPIETIQKRPIPLPPSNVRRRSATKKNLVTPNTTTLNPNLLAPHTKNKYGTTNNPTGPPYGAKKPPKPSTIFIEPKKTQPSMPPRSFGSFSCDEPHQMKRISSFEKQNVPDDDQNPSAVSSTWIPPSRAVVPRAISYLQNNSFYDDETSSDESNYESLLIRNKKYVKTTTTNNSEKNIHIDISNLIIPTAVYVTDPDGNSQMLDFDEDSIEKHFSTGRFLDNDFMATSKNVSNVNVVSNSCSSSTVVKSSSSERIFQEKYTLHSIGEEEGEEERDGPISKYNGNKNILSTEPDRTTVSQKLKTTKSNTNQPENNQIRMSRRWSDGSVSDDDDNTLRLQQRAVVKMPSTPSIAKQASTPTSKVSIRKFLLTKLHLTSPTQNNDNSNTALITTHPPRPKRFVHRSSDKKRYQTQ